MSTYTLKKIEVIQEGYYPVTISKVEEVTGEFGRQERFTLSLPGNRELLAWASASYTTKSKLYKWVRAVLFSGGSVPEDYILDTQHFIGKQAIAHITVGINTKGDDWSRGLKPASGEYCPAASAEPLRPGPAAPEPTACRRASGADRSEPEPVDPEDRLA